MLTLSSNNSACVAPRTVLLLTATLFLVLTRSAGSNDLRSWSDSSETVTFRAQYISSERGWVNIKREDGGLGRVPLKWLSASDQDYVQQATVNADVSRQTPSPTAVENSPRKKTVSLEALASVDLPAPGDVDKTVEGFIAYDIGNLGGLEGSRARDDFGRLGVESVGPLIRGLNEAAKLGNSCPIIVLRSKLAYCLSQANDPRLDVMAVCNLGCGVPQNAPHYRMLCELRTQCIGRLPVNHPVKLQQDRVDRLLTGNDEAAVDRSLRSDDAIERHAAVTAACSMGPRFGKELISMLNDPAPEIRQKARAGLVAMAANVDFGPDEPANERVRSTAIRKWEEWYEQKVRFALPPAAWRYSRTQLKGLLKTKQEQTSLAAILVIRYRRHFMVNELLALFDDPSQAVRREAHNALVDLAEGADCGPSDFSNTADVKTAIAGWKVWDERRKRRFRNGIKTNDQIKAEMDSPDNEVRLAAVSTATVRSLLVANKFVIRISDSVPEIQQAARHGLVQLASGVDFGPSEGAGATAVAESSGRWRQWLSTYVPPSPPR